MSNCTSPNPCQTDSGSVIYTSGNLSCINANTNDSLSFVLFKLNQKICELQEQLDECCSSSTTSTTTSTTTIALCNNPLVGILNLYGDPVGTFNLKDFLDLGSIEPICNNCCPDCGQIYIFSSVETFLKLYENFPVNISESACCSNTCSSQFEQYVGNVKYLPLLDKGLVEYSTIGGKSILCYFVEYAEAYGLTGDQLTGIVDEILDSGIVIYCDGENQVIGSVEAFDKYVETSGITPSLDECCTSVIASVETYNTFLGGTSGA